MQSRRQRHAHRRILADAFGGELLAGCVGNAGDAQSVVQLEYRDGDVVQRGDLHAGLRQEAVRVGLKLGINDVIVCPKAWLFGGQRGQREGNEQSRQEPPDEFVGNHCRIMAPA